MGRGYFYGMNMKMVNEVGDHNSAWAEAERKEQKLVKTQPLPGSFLHIHQSYYSQVPVAEWLAGFTTASPSFPLSLPASLTRAPPETSNWGWRFAGLRVSAGTPGQHSTKLCAFMYMYMDSHLSSPAPAKTAVAGGFCSFTGRWHQGTICKHCPPEAHDEMLS